jgi:DUF1680 family protein
MVNGKPVAGAVAGQYLALQRKWSSGDVINVKLGMTPQVIEASPRVVEDYGRVTVQRGPLVYCLEQLDQPDGVALVDVSWTCDSNLARSSTRSFNAICLGESWC